MNKAAMCLSLVLALSACAPEREYSSGDYQSSGAVDAGGHATNDTLSSDRLLDAGHVDTRSDASAGATSAVSSSISNSTDAGSDQPEEHTSNPIEQDSSVLPELDSGIISEPQATSSQSPEGGPEVNTSDVNTGTATECVPGVFGQSKFGMACFQ